MQAGQAVSHPAQVARKDLAPTGGAGLQKSPGSRARFLPKDVGWGPRREGMQEPRLLLLILHTPLQVHGTHEALECKMWTEETAKCLPGKHRDLCLIPRTMMALREAA